MTYDEHLRSQSTLCEASGLRTTTVSIFPRPHERETVHDNVQVAMYQCLLIKANGNY